MANSGDFPADYSGLVAMLVELPLSKLGQTLSTIDNMPEIANESELQKIIAKVLMEGSKEDMNLLKSSKWATGAIKADVVGLMSELSTPPRVEKPIIWLFEEFCTTEDIDELAAGWPEFFNDQDELLCSILVSPKTSETAFINFMEFFWDIMMSHLRDLDGLQLPDLPNDAEMQLPMVAWYVDNYAGPAPEINRRFLAEPGDLNDLEQRLQLYTWTLAMLLEKDPAGNFLEEFDFRGEPGVGLAYAMVERYENI